MTTITGPQFESQRANSPQHRTCEVRTNRRGRPLQIHRPQIKEAIMKIVIIGGSGLIGSKLVTQLRNHGHAAVAASPKSGVNTITCEGLAAALQAASVV